VHFVSLRVEDLGICIVSCICIYIWDSIAWYILALNRALDRMDGWTCVSSYIVIS
jgi:hypothetical protein